MMAFETVTVKENVINSGSQMKSKNKAILLQAIAGVSGTCAETVDIPELRKRRSVKILEKSGVKEVDYAEGARRKMYVSPENLDEWKSRDFARYALRLYEKRYSEKWNVRFLGLSIYMKNIRESLEETFGFCDNLVFRDYLDYFFHQWSDSFRASSQGELYVSRFLEKKPLRTFYEQYNYESRLQEKLTTPAAPTKKQAVNGTEDDAFLLGDEKFVYKFGLLIPVNYLIQKKGFETKQALVYVANGFMKLVKKNAHTHALKATEHFSPYSANFSFKNINGLINVLEKRTGLSLPVKVNFSQGSK